MSILEKMKALELKGTGRAFSFKETSFFNKPNVVAKLPIPIINIAFSGKVDGGLASGITTFAGDSKTFKSLLSFTCLKSYLDTYEDAIGIVYDTEFGITPQSLENLGIDPDRVLHIPIGTVEALKFDMYNRLNQIEKGEHVFFLIDSLGLLASAKEAKDAQEENSAADMVRAKEIRSLFRLITVPLSMKDLPCVIVNHYYTEMKMYGANIVSGGKAPMLASNQVFIITKEKETEGEGKEKELVGYTFKLNVEKSRYVKEKSVFGFTVLYDYGIEFNSGLFDLALEAGIIKKVSPQKYNINDDSTTFKRKELEEDRNVWINLLKDKKFQTFIEDKYMLKGAIINNDENDQE